MTILASMDIGSYTTRLLVAQVKEENKIKALLRERIYTRIGEDLSFFESMALSEEAQVRVIEAVRKLYGQALSQGATTIFAAATGVIRESRNGAQLVQRVYEETGLKIEIISELEEAALTGKGALSALSDVGPPLVVFDLGGGTTEFFYMAGDQENETVFSLPVGAAVLTQQFLREDPPSAHDIAAAQEAVRGLLRGIPNLGNDGDKPGTVIGTGGTVTSLAAMSYNLNLEDVSPERLNGARISVSQTRGIFDRIKQLRSFERALLPGLDSSRADVIIAGALCVITILEHFHTTMLVVSLSDILEGLLINGLTKIDRL